MSAPEQEMWISGDEDGGVSVVCARPECMKPGPVTQHNPRGLYHNPQAVLPWRPEPHHITAAWQEHLATHDLPRPAAP